MCNRLHCTGSHGQVDKEPRVLEDGSVIESLGGEYRKTLTDGTVIRHILGNSQTDYPDGSRVVEWTTGDEMEICAIRRCRLRKHPDGRVETFA